MELLENGTAINLERSKETLNKQRQHICGGRPNRNMKDFSLLHDNARPHTSFRTREAIARMEWTLLSQPVQSPDLTPSDYHLFDPLKHELYGRHFADDNEWKQSLRDVLQCRGKEFHIAGIQSLNQRRQKCVENERDLVKNSLTITKDM